MINMLFFYTSLSSKVILIYRAQPTINTEIQFQLDLHGRTFLHLAARGGHFHIFQYLLSLGFDSATNDEKGENLLHYTASGG